MAAGCEAAFDEAILRWRSRSQPICDAHAVAAHERSGTHDLQCGPGCIEGWDDAAADAGAPRVHDGTARKRADERCDCDKPWHNPHASG